MNRIMLGEVIIMTKKGIPKRDGSGKGVGANTGRGGCTPVKNKNKRNRR